MAIETLYDKDGSINALSGKTVAVVGFGRIGRKVSELLKAFDAKIVVVDPAYPAPPDGFTLLNLDEALKLADVVTLHSSGEDRLIGDPELQQMKTREASARAEADAARAALAAGTTTANKTAVKKTAAKKAAAKKTTAKKTTAKNTAAKNTAAKNTTAKKTTKRSTTKKG